MLSLRSHVLIALSVTAACGGGGHDTDAQPPFDSHAPADAPADARADAPVDSPPPIDATIDATVDAAPLPDSASAANCLMASTYDRDFDDPPDGTIDVLSLGTVGFPVDLDAQLIDLDGDGIAETNAVAIIGVLNGLPGEEVIVGNHGYQFVFIDGLGMFTAPNNFANAPVPNATNLDTGATCGGCLEGWGGWADTAPIDLNTATQLYLTDTGTMTLTQFSPGLVAGSTSLLAGSYNTISMTGFDPVTQTPLDPPCTSTVTQLNFALNVTWPTPTVAPVHTSVRGIDWTKAPRIPFGR